MSIFEGKTAFVTGGANGIGLGIARAMISRGVNVMLADIDEQRMAAAASSLGGGNGKVETVFCDVGDVQSVRDAAAATIEAFGKVHFVFNNAGVGMGGETGDIALKDWKWIVDINLMGVVYGMEVVTPLIKSHGEGGQFVNTASMAGHWAAPKMGPYNATKFAVVGYSESVRQELAEHDINVGVLCPGWVKTDIAKENLNRPSKADGDDVDMAEEIGTDGADMGVAELVENGMSPDVVGELVADSMEAKRWYTFNHAANASCD